METSHRTRVGFLVPPGNWTIEQEIPAFLPEDVSINFNRLSRVDHTNEGEQRKLVTADNLNVMANSVGRAARDLAEASPEMIVYCCTSGSFVNGWAGHVELSNKITSDTGVPAITTSTAVLSALKVLGAKKVVMVAPYPENIIDIEVNFFNHFDIDIVARRRIDCPTDDDIRAVKHEATAAAVLDAVSDVDEYDAVFISCTNLQIMPQIASLEDTLGKPVVTSNQASLWASLPATSGKPRRPVGQLFNHPFRPFS
ncbi:MAG TPA: aspartate/glutamate racemase family protein [Rhizobium sp.]